MRTFVGVMCAALVLVGCSVPEEEPVDPSKLDQAGRFACEDFGTGYESAQTGQARVELANTVNEWAPKSQTTGLAEAGKALGNAADLTPGAWQLAADSFAQICLDASGVEQ
ncbi:hypothetical protein [Amycolatopsis palatopharyngis]|uniref:hypothetical protein n=1 Tax=Amycolatopsis palatopharyngis TaxID=187982 RepID=UPI0013BEA06A|nr:hypothetical protein [Amycolatopsis palatopharyngis]